MGFLIDALSGIKIKFVGDDFKKYEREKYFPHWTAPVHNSLNLPKQIKLFLNRLADS